MLQSRIKINSAAYGNNVLFKSALVKELSEGYQKKTGSE